ncbi:HAD family phosphatase [Micromonospora sp. WMMD998]|uniref:HAD family hydrolase n=1 Tax=Micromonospora sp. WMMD998 TaxID=3016092 RepID=UPI00249BF5CF|nr:HAD family phosphatase [Micromonospora sp. WMMD998]WFE39547.1 HAD family phosphatase [Micromonospora sp. WMMD998]
MTLPLPAGDFRAYLFDCDGTIVDSMPVHHRAWNAALAEWDCELPEDLFYAWGGRPVVDIVVDLNERHGLAMPVDTVTRRREELFQRLLPGVTAVPEVLAHIEDAHGRVPFAVVSGSTRESVTASLTALGLLDRFETLVCAEDCARPKPDPEGYLLAARRLGVDPAGCLVFEDTDLGVEAATAAGMASVRVPHPRERAASR